MMKEVKVPFKHPLIFTAILLLFSITGCSSKLDTTQPGAEKKEKQEGTKIEKDIHSFANTDDVVVTHLDLDVGVDFGKKQIAGRSSLQINNKTGAKQLYL